MRTLRRRIGCIVVIIAPLFVGAALRWMELTLEADLDKVQIGMSEYEVEEILGTPYYSKTEGMKAKFLSIEKRDPEQIIMITRKGYQLNDRKACYVEYGPNGDVVYKSNGAYVANPDLIKRVRMWLSRHFRKM